MLGLSALLCATIAGAQTTTYSEDFVAGTAYDPGDSQVDNWDSFRAGLTGTYASISVGGSQGPGATCNDAAAIATITSALNTDGTASVSCAGQDWNVGTCVGETELSVGAGICVCSGASPFTLRPDVDVGGAAGAAWGGIGGTCESSPNVDQTLTVSVQAIGAPTDADLSLSIAPASTAPSTGSNTFIDVNLNNFGPADATGVVVNFPLPSGLTYISDDVGGAYNSATGVWTVGNVPAGTSPRLRVVAGVAAAGNFALAAEVAAANENDPDSTPGNAATAPGEDDSDAVTLTPVIPPPPLFCLGRPIQPLIFVNPIAESPGANLAAPQVGDVFRFGNVSPGVDALVEVTAFNNGATLAGIDNDGTAAAPVGVPDNFQPTLVGPAGDVSVDFQITVVATGTSTPGTLDFAGSAIDIDGNGVGVTEYVEVSNNIVEFALNGVPVPADPTGPATRLITQANTPPDAGASAPSAANRVRFEAETVDTAAGIDPTEPRNIAAAFFTDVSVFEYRIGKLGDATPGRLNSLAFNCPAIDPGTGGSAPVLDEDFGDAPFDAATNSGYGNPIHVIDPSDPLVHIGATNTAETGPGNSATASSDAGDDGVTAAGASFQGTSLQGLVTTQIVVGVTNSTTDIGLLQVFFDWNADGDFDDAGEQVATDIQDGGAGDTDSVAGTITLDVTPPVGTVAGSSFARFRWSTSSVGVQDPAGDGEVEDYLVTLLEAPPADLSLTLDASNNAPAIGDPVTLTVTLTNDGPGAGTGISASIPLPPGLTFVSSDGGAAFDPATGLWTLPADLASGDSVVLTIQVTANAAGTSDIDAEIVTADQNDPDSTPANADTLPAEDDTDSETIVTSVTPPVCPAGLTLMSQAGTASSVVSETSIGNSGFALGPLSPAGTTPPDPVAAFVNIGGSSVLVLDLGVVVPENAQLVFSLARDNGADNLELEIRHALVSNAFPNSNVLAIYGLGPAADVASTVENTLEQVTLTVPSGGLQFLRFDILNGDNGFVDGISYSQICVPGAELSGAKTVEVFDPLGEGLFALPGNDVTYTITVSNIGGGSTDEDSIFLIDELPAETIFFNGDADGPGPGTDPVNFEDVVASGLDPFVFSDSVRFAGTGPAPTSFDNCALTPAAGFDPNIRFVCFNPKGIMEAGTPDPEFNLSFRARIQ